MHTMPMHGGAATMSSIWMPTAGQSWVGAAASFVGMWVVMMAVMMLPVLVPMLWQYRRTLGPIGEMRRLELTAIVAIGYFLVWTLLGATAFSVGAAWAAIAMWHPTASRVAPIAAGIVVVIAGALQLTAWKARCLAGWKDAIAHTRTLPADAAAAWRHGLCLGVHCARTCAGLMAILLVVGVMDFRAMAIVTAAITAERFAPTGIRVARAIGAVAVGAGMFLIALAAAA